MKVELENRFKTKKYLIKTNDNKKLDCILILSNSDEIKRKLLGNETNLGDQSDIFSSEITLKGPLMLFCNPNAGYYEYMYYEVYFSFHLFVINHFIFNRVTG